MIDQISPGSRVHVKIVKRPTNAAAAKTLVRLLSKDKAVKANDTRLRAIRQDRYSPSPRGGRLYGGRMVKLPAVKAEIGVSGTIVASLDVLTDLKSVHRFIEISSVK